MRWEESKDSAIKEAIFDYNREDCLALQQVANFLVSLASSESTANPLVQQASEIHVESHGRFGKIDFAIPEMTFINKCACFNYQRDKVLARTDPAVRARVRRNRATARPIQKPNVEVRCDPPIRCPGCGATQITSLRNKSHSKVIYDLKFPRTGVKRCVITYYSQRSQCQHCGKTFYSEMYPKEQKTGHALASWAVYQHVALRQSFADIALSIDDIFGYRFSGGIGQRAQTRLAEVYRVTVDKMLKLLRSGMLLHGASVANIIDVKFADSDQLIRGFGGNHHQLA
jgi:hypothetical protein